MAEAWNPKDAFLRARELSPQEREAFLSRVCPDEAARKQVLDLLAHTDTDRFDWIAPEPPLDIGTLAPGTDVGQYRIVRLIGGGGMGVVYLAKNTALDKPVALKFLATHLTTSRQAVARFIDEAKHTATLNHSAIVQVIDLCRSHEQTCIVSEYVDGPTLSEMIKSEREARGERPPTKSLRAWQRYCAQTISTIADALHAAHCADIVHCDVKPSNILVDRARGPRLTDFGIARHLAPDAPATFATSMLSSFYASPEQASLAGSRLDGRSDIFSLGVVMYEMLALQRPFDGDDDEEILEAVQSVDPPKLRTVSKRIPVELQTICQKALEKKPERRYASAAEMAADLRRYLAGEPIAASGRSAWTGVQLWVAPRKLRLAVGMGLVAAAASIYLGWRAWATRLESMARVTIECRELTGDWDVVVRRFDREDRTLGPASRWASGPVNAERIASGSYRFIVRAPGGLYAEFDEVLEAGAAVRRIVWLRAQALGEESMVKLSAGSHAVNYLNPSDGLAVRQTTAIPAFLIDATEVSNGEYQRYLDALAAVAPEEVASARPKIWSDSRCGAGTRDLPVVDLSLEQMKAYALWAGKRMPTLQEWMAAAQAPDGRTRPWTGAPPAELKWTSEIAQAAQTRTEEGQVDGYFTYASPVNRPADARSALGLFHMFGNVMEMTGTVVASDRGYVVVLAGGSWGENPSTFTLEHPAMYPRTGRSPQIGFRCVRSVASSATTP